MQSLPHHKAHGGKRFWSHIAFEKLHGVQTSNSVPIAAPRLRRTVVATRWLAVNVDTALIGNLLNRLPLVVTVTPPDVVFQSGVPRALAVRSLLKHSLQSCGPLSSLARFLLVQPLQSLHYQSYHSSGLARQSNISGAFVESDLSITT